VYQAFHEYTPDGQKESIVAGATDWWNGEGYDLSISSAKDDKIISIHIDEWTALLKTAKAAKTNGKDRAKTTFKTVLGPKKSETTEVETQIFADKKDFTTSITDPRKTKSISLSWHELDGLRTAVKMLHDAEHKRIVQSQTIKKPDPRFFYDPFDL
jgi:hypothetical protein